jgi:predicted Zn-dependent peptidase
MPKAMIQISEKANRILNIVKAKYDLKDKSQAINKMAEEFSEVLLEPQLKPEYVKKLRKIEEEETVSEEEFERMLKVKI